MTDTTKPASSNMPRKRYLTISEASKLCGVTPAILRHWEDKFPMLKPCRRTGDRRYYREADIELILQIKELAHNQGLSLNKACLRLSRQMQKNSFTHKIYTEQKIQNATQGMQHFDVDLYFTTQSIMDICRVSEKTASRYRKTGKAPYAACRLLELVKRGRILPEKWTHCFINNNKNLEICGIGEVHENDILNIQWAKKLYASHIQTVTNELTNTRARVKELEVLLSTAKSNHNTNEQSGAQTMKDPNLYAVKRQFEIILEAFQGLENIASNSEGDAPSVGKAMIPIIFQAEEVLKDLETLYQKSKLSQQDTSPNKSPSLVLLNFPKSENEKH